MRQFHVVFEEEEKKKKPPIEPALILTDRYCLCVSKFASNRSYSGSKTTKEKKNRTLAYLGMISILSRIFRICVNLFHFFFVVVGFFSSSCLS